LPQPAKLRERLAAAGARLSLGEYVLTNLLVAVGLFVVLFNLGKFGLFVALPLSFAAGISLPHLVIGNMIGRRQRKFLSQFADAVDLIVRGLKSGVPVSESIRLVGQEIPDPVGIEFRQIMDSMAMGQTITEAFAAASKRIDLPEFRFFVISLTIQQETGGNLAETLENLSSIVRQRKQMKLKIRSISSEARASAYILGSLPFLMFGGLSLMSPDYMAILFDGTRGHLVIAGAMTSLAIGVGTMIKMGKFDI
jgi:tight adherence protein B